MKSNDFKAERRQQWEKKKARHDGNHGKNGYVGGNPRYNGGGSRGVKSPTHFRGPNSRSSALTALHPNRLRFTLENAA